jgi:hypothetical protein
VKRIFVTALLLLSQAAAADERILHFHSDILVRSDGTIEVTETIKVRAEGSKIRRGIYRDFPTRYRDHARNRVVVAFEPRSVLRDGRREAFHSQDLSNGVRTYFGSTSRFLEPGEYTYTFHYDASRMLGFFEEHDELYWNVTGHGWDFPIDSASATVSFQFDVASDSIGVEAYTGAYGADGRDYVARADGRGGAEFETTAVLPAHQGLTIVVTWPKGQVTVAGATDRISWFLSDNVNAMVALVGLIAMFSYYVPVWRSFGRDPEEGVIVTRYEPPTGFSPASLRYIEQMYYDDKAMTAAVVNLAVKGYLNIEEIDDIHSLKRTDPGDNPPALAAGERELLGALFEDDDIVILDDENHVVLGGARAEHERVLSRDYKSRYFRTNGASNLPPLLIGLAATIVSLNVGDGPAPIVFGSIVLMFVTLVFFAIIMKRPTGLGRKLLDEMLGFKDYLEIAEKDEMNLRNPPEKTPALFEKYLPFALALGVEQEWAERFAEVFENLRGPENTPYQPAWYNGTWNNVNLGSNTSSLTGGLSSAISSSVTPPGSSSGGGGGGFSGGGGGGGGGGGW